MKVRDIDKGFKRIVAEFGKADGQKVKVGVLATAGSEGGADLASIAGWNEFGVPNSRLKVFGRKTKEARIPERPFMRNTFEKRKEDIKKYIDDQHGKVIDAGKSYRDALAAIGFEYSGYIRDEISSGKFAANKAFTISRKGGGKQPLVDSGRLAGSIQWEFMD
jgi:hypothetical protein